MYPLVGEKMVFFSAKPYSLEGPRCLHRATQFFDAVDNYSKIPN